MLALLCRQRGALLRACRPPQLGLTACQALLEDGEGALSEGSEKRDKSDFALWKVLLHLWFMARNDVTGISGKQSGGAGMGQPVG
jgi:hypothetical protein